MELSFAFGPEALPLGLLIAKLILTLTPGLLFASAPFIALLIGQPGLLIPLAVLAVTRLALLVSVATLVNAAAVPLSALIVLLLLLGSSLLFSEAALFVSLPLLSRAPLLLILLILLASQVCVAAL